MRPTYALTVLYKGLKTFIWVCTVHTLWYFEGPLLLVHASTCLKNCVAFKLTHRVQLQRESEKTQHLTWKCCINCCVFIDSHGRKHIKCKVRWPQNRAIFLLSHGYIRGTIVERSVHFRVDGLLPHYVHTIFGRDTQHSVCAQYIFLSTITVFVTASTRGAYILCD